MSYYSQCLNLCHLRYPQKVTDSTNALLAAWNYPIKRYKLIWQLAGYTDLFRI